jgi:hypothetical protein
MTTISKTYKPRKAVAYSGDASPVDAYYNRQHTEDEPIVKPQHNATWGKFDKKNQAHMNCMSLLRQAKWTKIWEGKTIPDIQRFSNFLHSEKAPVNKALLKMDKDEVSKTITALEGIVKSTY